MANTVVARVSWVGGRAWLYWERTQKSFGGDRIVLYPDCGSGYMDLYVLKYKELEYKNKVNLTVQ